MASFPAFARMISPPPGWFSRKEDTSYTLPWGSVRRRVHIGWVLGTHVDDDPAIVPGCVFLHLVVVKQLLSAGLLDPREMIVSRCERVIVESDRLGRVRYREALDPGQRGPKVTKFRSKGEGRCVDVYEGGRPGRTAARARATAAAVADRVLTAEEVAYGRRGIGRKGDIAERGERVWRRTPSAARRRAMA